MRISDWSSDVCSSDLIFDGLRNLGKLPPDVRDFMHRPQLLHVTKANRRATVHRAVALDTIAVKTFDAKGKVTGERLFAGLFTSMAYSRSPSLIPLLRPKVDAVSSEGPRVGKGWGSTLRSWWAT